MNSYADLLRMDEKAQLKAAMATGDYRIEKLKDGAVEARRYGMRLGSPVATKAEAQDIIRKNYLGNRKP